MQVRICTSKACVRCTDIRIEAIMLSSCTDIDVVNAISIHRISIVLEHNLTLQAILF